MELLVAAAVVGEQFANYLQNLLGLDGTTVVNVLRIVGIDIVLAGDNAVVIALACRSLPPNQRMVGIILGAGVAVLLRIFFTIIIQHLLEIYYLKLIGAFLLIWIAVKLLTADNASEEHVKTGNSLWEAVRIVAIADLVMSLDNMLAIAAAAGGNTNLIIFGLALSIPLVVGGSTLILSLLTKFPVLIWAGAALLGWISGELFATEPMLAPMVNSMAEALQMTPKGITRIFEVIGVATVLTTGWIILRRSRSKTGHA
ncbi:TerC family protein [Leptospira interrogans]